MGTSRSIHNPARRDIQTDGPTDSSTDPSKMKELAIQLHDLNQTCSMIEELQNELKNLEDVKEICNLQNFEPEDNEFEKLQAEYNDRCNRKADQLYRVLMEKGYLVEEVEDDIDLNILKFIEYAGPEYAWRLSINIGISMEEAREHLENLLWKGLVERVPGNMLDNYHREKDWTKHMNHTYYRITREGRLYLRKLRRELEDQETGME